MAITGAGVVQELLIERAASRGLVGNIYVGRVARVLPGMQSAFIEIGLERAAFLHVGDIRDQRRAADREDPRRGPAAPGAGGEGPDRLQGRAALDAGLDRRAPAGVSAASDADPHIGISQKIGDENGRAALRERLRELLPPDEKGGFIVRTLAETASRRRAARRPRLPAAAVGRDPRTLAGREAAAAPVPGPVARAARAARHGDRRTPRAWWSTRARTTRSSRRSPRSTCRRCAAASSTTPASGRCSTCTTSRPRSRRRCRAASSSSPAAPWSSTRPRR